MSVAWRNGSVVRRMLSLVSTGMGDSLRADTISLNVTKPTRSTQRCIPLGSLNQVQALAGVKAGM